MESSSGRLVGKIVYFGKKSNNPFENTYMVVKPKNSSPEIIFEDLEFHDNGRRYGIKGIHTLVKQTKGELKFLAEPGIFQDIHNYNLEKTLLRASKELKPTK